MRTPESEPRDDAGDPTPSAPREEEVNPEWPDPMPTESQVIAAVTKDQFDRLPSDEKAASQARWDALPEWRKQDLRDEIEFDLL